MMPRQTNDPNRAVPLPRNTGEAVLGDRSVDQESFLLSSHRTRLSLQRTRMSADRTLMSIIRTALSLIGFGFTIFQFFHYLQQSANATAIVRPHAARDFGVALVTLGVLLLTLGIIVHVRFMLELRHEHDHLAGERLIPSDHFPVSVTLVSALLLLCVGILAIVSMVARIGPFT
jgi:putative membrane protein